ncbi:MAG TPA: hypothetical protein VMY99_00800 [Nevskiaceae bacterium]|nr:hypothetical protein [Nevskiaceae bacterium]
MVDPGLFLVQRSHELAAEAHRRAHIPVLPAAQAIAEREDNILKLTAYIAEQLRKKRIDPGIVVHTQVRYEHMSATGITEATAMIHDEKPGDAVIGSAWEIARIGDSAPGQSPYRRPPLLQRGIGILATAGAEDLVRYKRARNGTYYISDEDGSPDGRFDPDRAQGPTCIDTELPDRKNPELVTQAHQELGLVIPPTDSESALGIFRRFSKVLTIENLLTEYAGRMGLIPNDQTQA